MLAAHGNSISGSAHGRRLWVSLCASAACRELAWAAGVTEELANRKRSGFMHTDAGSCEALSMKLVMKFLKSQKVGAQMCISAAVLEIWI